MSFYRITPERPSVGQILPPSYVWDDDGPTNDLLPGTCAFTTERLAREYGKQGGCWLIEINGERAGYGYELDGEVYVRNAVVARVVCLL